MSEEGQGLEVLLTETRRFPPPEHFTEGAIVQDRGIVSYTQLVKGTIRDNAQLRRDLLRNVGAQIAEDFPNVLRWYDQVAARPAVAKDMARLEDTADQREWTDERWANLFGAEQHRRR